MNDHAEGRGSSVVEVRRKGGCIASAVENKADVNLQKCRDPTMKTARNEDKHRKDMRNGDRTRIGNVGGVEFWRSSQ